MHPMLLEIPARLESDRLYLQPYQVGDGAWLAAALTTNRAHLAESLTTVHSHFGLNLTKAEDAEIFVRRMESDWIARQRFVFGIWEKRDARYVGQIWIECRNWGAALHELGYYLLQAETGTGFATEAAKQALHFLFGTLHAEKVSLTCDVDNIRSWHVAERCGFQQEGRLRNEVRRNDGTLVDKLYYGLLKDEWQLLHSAQT